MALKLRFYWLAKHLNLRSARPYLTIATKVVMSLTRAYDSEPIDESRATKVLLLSNLNDRRFENTHTPSPFGCFRPSGRVVNRVIPTRARENSRLRNRELSVLGHGRLPRDP